MSRFAPVHNAAEIGWFQEASTLFLKDVRAELRTKVAISAVGVFTFASLLLLSLATETLKSTRAVRISGLPDPVSLSELTNAMHPAWNPVSKLGILWVLLCFAAFAGLAHSFVHEEETGTVLALRLSMTPTAVFAGKFAFNLVLILAVTVLVTPAYILITGMPTGPWIVFISVMMAGCIGLAGAATIIAALAAKAHGTGALYGALGLPILVVFLVLLLNSANTLYVVNAPLMQLIKDVGGLLSYGILLITVSAITFHFVWEE